MRLLPRDEKFFDFFSAVATFTVEAAGLLQELLRADAQRRTAIVDQIKRLEQAFTGTQHGMRHSSFAKGAMNFRSTEKR